MSQLLIKTMRWWTCVVILCVAVTASDASGAEWLEVQTAQGPVRGRRDHAAELYAFYNIPYATAPTGDHKFKAPLSPPTWTETYDAVNKHTIICPQMELKAFMPENVKKQEDCLVVNVYVPDTKDKNLSVLVYVHGGGFQIGFGNWLKTKHLMKNKDLIVVNFNYRLGIHGFLCLGTEDAPGNAGMKDQVALLRWVQQNIAAFGGNPNDVTIAGYSAGSISVNLLMISKAAQGLFHKVIPESGSSLAAYSIQRDPLQKAKDHALLLNFTDFEDIYKLEEFYKSLPYELLELDVFNNRPDLFSPCIERDMDGAFLTESPLSILSRGDYKKVPMLYGFSNMEGLLRIDLFDYMWKDLMNKKFSDFLPGDLNFKTQTEKEQVSKQVKALYFGDKPITEENILQYVQYFSDTYYVYSTLWSVSLHAKAGHDQLYLYEYSFVDEHTPFVPHTNVRGATHCAQTMAVNDGVSLVNSNENNITEEYRNMKKIMREIWHSFIKTGKPIPEGSSLPKWPPVGVDLSPHMSLGQKVELRGTLLSERAKFWDLVYQKYYGEPIPPPQLSPRSHSEL